LETSQQSQHDGAYTFINTYGIEGPYAFRVWEWNGSTEQRPTPDEYNDEHIYYFYFTGSGTSENFYFIENGGAYGDNWGSLTIEIWRSGNNLAACDCDGNVDLGCGCGEPGPTGCDNVCNSTAFVDCEGQCADEYYAGWVGDGYCDDGAWGFYFNCDEFSCDNGDCLDACDVCSGDGSSCCDCCEVSNGDNSTCGSTGDVNGDGVLNVNDVVSLVPHILETSTLSECEINEADVTGDGMVNVIDAIISIELIIINTVYGCTDAVASTL
jgi:hypothetical protein